MKLSSLSAGNAVSISASHHVHESVVSQLHQTARTFFSKLDQMGSAIAIGESGDLDRAQDLREKYADR